MTDRGIPTVDGAAACPFIAFDDDRDGRSTAPDHRHRCFAEPVPAPRAIAHQDAYCLSPAFAVCPTFQDWARREAAAARPPAPAPAPTLRSRDDDTSRPVPTAPTDRELPHAASTAGQPSTSRRPQPRDWAAPPPWLAEGDGRPDDEPAGATPLNNAAPGAIPGWSVDGAAPGAPALGGAGLARSRGHDDWGDAGRGLAASAAARLAGPDPDLPSAARPTRSWSSSPAANDDDDEDPEDLLDDGLLDVPVAPNRPQSSAARQTASRPAAGGSIPGRPVPAPRTRSTRSAARPTPQDAGDLFGPAWERPRRYEAYPSLKARVGLPSLRGIPRLGLGAIALIVAAAFLFFVSPMILHLNKDTSPGASTQASAGASAAPTVSPSPTVAPEPTATIYVVKSGDTLSGIAQQFNTTVKALLKANPQIKNQNAIKIGDRVTIPAPSSTSSGAVSGASPSAILGASAAP
jgi:LysM repeat protein